jgi:hypothetical protein
MTKVPLRVRYIWRSFREGWASLWTALEVIGLLVGGSVLAYLALALEEPLLAAGLLLLAVVGTIGEGAFRLNRISDQQLAEAREALTRLEEDAPRLTFGRAVIPPKSQPYKLSWGDGESFLEHGRVIRVPIQNGAGAENALAVQARLTFQPKDIHSSFSPKHPVVGEWDEPNGPSVEIELPGNDSPRYLNVIFIRDRPYPHGFVWTRESRGAGLSGFAIASNRIEIDLEITAAGPMRPVLTDTLIVECRPRQMLVADWASRNGNEEGNNVEWWDGEEM